MIFVSIILFWACNIVCNFDYTTVIATSRFPMTADWLLSQHPQLLFGDQVLLTCMQLLTSESSRRPKNNIKAWTTTGPGTTHWNGRDFDQQTLCGPNYSQRILKSPADHMLTRVPCNAHHMLDAYMYVKGLASYSGETIKGQEEKHLMRVTGLLLTFLVINYKESHEGSYLL